MAELHGLYMGVANHLLTGMILQVGISALGISPYFPEGKLALGEDKQKHSNSYMLHAGKFPVYISR